MCKIVLNNEYNFLNKGIMSMKRTLIKGGHVLSMDAGVGIMEKGDILVENGVIAHIAPEIQAGDAMCLSATDRFVMPGFVDAHRHMWQTQLRALTADWSLYDYTSRIRLNYASFYTPDDAYLGIYAGLLEALNAGATTIVDHCHIINTPEHADEAVRAYEDSRARGIWCYGLFVNFPETGKPDVATLLDPAWRYEDARRLQKRHFAFKDQRVKMGVALSENEFFPAEYVEKEIRFARSIEAAAVSIHAGMGAMSRPLKYVSKLAGKHLLGPDLLFVHGSSFSDDDLKLLSENGSAVVSTPETELQMGMGFPVFCRAMAQGAKTAIGIDIVSNNSADMFTQIRLAMAGQRALENEELGQRGMSPRKVCLTARQMVQLATIGGAEALRLDSTIGSLKPGKQADIILIKKDSINMFPVNDPFNTIVMSANAGDVDTVMVAGDLVKENGRLVNVDLKSLREKIEKSRLRILALANQRGFSMGESIAENFFPLTPASAFQLKIAGPTMRLPFLDKMLLKALIQKAQKQIS
jgi:cytosine/adenosine deaminase-related metal-dependent hydrolase